MKIYDFRKQFNSTQVSFFLLTKCSKYSSFPLFFNWQLMFKFNIKAKLSKIITPVYS